MSSGPGRRRCLLHGCLFVDLMSCSALRLRGFMHDFMHDWSKAACFSRWLVASPSSILQL